MQIQKIWIATKRGVAFTKKCTVAAGICAFCYEVLPNTLLLPFKRIRQQEAMEASLGLKDIPYEIQEYVRQAIDDLKFNEDQRKALSVYLTQLSAVGTYGHINSPFGTLVKLPWALWSRYSMPDFIPGEEGKFPEASKQYFESLQWSDKAKLYFAAYQVAWTTRYQFLTKGIFNVVGIASAYTACYLFSRGRYPLTENIAALVACNLLIIVLFLVSWMIANDLTSYENEDEVIKEVCGLGPDYAEGAVELYKKLQQHNKALRDITGFMGRLKYNEEGNSRSPRRFTVPLSERIAIAETFIEKYQNENQPSSDKKEEQPSSDKKEEQPSSDKKEEQPSNDKKEEQPSNDKKEEQPSNDKKEEQPSNDKKEEQPSNDKKEEQPSNDKKEEQPSNDRKEEQPSNDRKEEQPSNDKKEEQSSGDKKKEKK